MIQLYKLINNQLQSAPTTLVVNSQLHAPCSSDTLIEQGWKPLKSAIRQNIEWYEKHVITYLDEPTEIVEVVTVSQADNLKNLYIQKLNHDCDVAIISGFVFTDSLGIKHPVWLSMENQFNFSQVEVPCELKLGQEDWLDLTAPNELNRFKKEVKDYITATLQACWQPKKDIKGFTDTQVFDYLKSL